MSDNTNQLIARLATETSAVKPVSLRALCGRWMAGFAAYTALLIAVTGVSPELSAALSRPLFVMEIALLAALVISAALTAGLLSFPDNYQYRKILWLPLPLLAAFIAVMGAAWMENPADLPHNSHGLECLSCISFYALIPGAWLFWQMRKMASTQGAIAGAAVVIATFSMGSLVLRLLEAGDSIPHMLQWHYLPMLVAALIGYALGKKLLKW